jgi:hypothetical protein
MKTRKQISIIVLLAIIALAIIGCKEDEPTPVPQPESPNKTLPAITTGTGKSVIITINNYVALSASAKTNLETSLQTALSGSNATGNLTINVIAGGTDGFSKTGSKTLSVGASWIANKSTDQILEGIVVTVGVDNWVGHAWVTVTNIC